MKKLISLSATLALLMVGLALTRAAYAQEPVVVTVTASEFKVEMSPLSVPANTPIKFVVTNKGKVVHEAVLEKAGAVDEPLEIDGKAAEIEDIDPGQTKDAVWTIGAPGEYQLACHVEGHYEAGMVQTFKVLAAPAKAMLPATGGETNPNPPVAPLLIGLGGLLILAGLILSRRRMAS